MVVMIDHFTSYVEVVPLRTIGGKAIMKPVLQGWIYRYGTPEFMYSDRGSEYLNQITSLLREIWSVDWKYTAGYSPQANGKVEVFNRMWKATVRCLSAGKPWERYLLEPEVTPWDELVQ